VAAISKPPKLAKQFFERKNIEKRLSENNFQGVVS
jgi:hypothetical protein